MSEKARALGIPDSHLVRALTLIRDFRLKALMEELDPRAIRIAIIYANLVDFRCARQKLDDKTLLELKEIANDFYAAQGGRT